MLGAAGQPVPGRVPDRGHGVESLGAGRGAERWSPTLCGEDGSQSRLPAVIHSGDYFLFESDSEEEEEAAPEDPRPSAQSAFQVWWEVPRRPAPDRRACGEERPCLASLPRSVPTSRAPESGGGRRSLVAAPWACVDGLPRSPRTLQALEAGDACLLADGAGALPTFGSLVLRKRPWHRLPATCAGGHVPCPHGAAPRDHFLPTLQQGAGCRSPVPARSVPSSSGAQRRRPGRQGADPEDLAHRWRTRRG